MSLTIELSVRWAECKLKRVEWIAQRSRILPVLIASSLVACLDFDALDRCYDARCAPRRSKDVGASGTGSLDASLDSGLPDAGWVIITSTQTIILPAQIDPPTVPPGGTARVTYNFDAAAMDENEQVFVLFVSPQDDAVVLDDSHAPLIPTYLWEGPISYTRTITLPNAARDGTYRIMAGLDISNQRALLNPGAGVVTDTSTQAGDQRRYEIGRIVVDHTAPPAPPISSQSPTLDLTNFMLTFSDEFNGPLDVSPSGPGTKWVSSTPDYQNYGFVGSSQAFSTGWAGGILCSSDYRGNGFSQQYGYFEMRAQFPGTLYSWPAFYLRSAIGSHAGDLGCLDQRRPAV
jgi:hypothetical protein